MAGIITIEDVIEKIIKEDIDDETELSRMRSLNNPFSGFTEGSLKWKMARIMRVKAVAAAFKERAKQHVAELAEERKQSGYLRMPTAPASSCI